DVFLREAETHEEIEARQRSGAGAAAGERDLGDILAHEPQAVQHGRRDDDRGPVLIVVEDGDAHPRTQLALDVEALRRLDVLEIDAAEGGLEARDDLDQLVRIRLGDLDVEDVDAGELLEETSLAFHHRLAGKSADAAEPQDGGPVRDHGDQVRAGGEE